MEILVLEFYLCLFHFSASQPPAYIKFKVLKYSLHEVFLFFIISCWKLGLYISLILVKATDKSNDVSEFSAFDWNML